MAAEPQPGEQVQGLRSLDEGFVPEILDPSLLDAKYLVSNRDAIAALRDLVFREGIFGGPSCGAVLVAAAREAKRMDARHDRRAAPRRRLEVPLGRHVRPRPRRDGSRSRGRRSTGGEPAGRERRATPGRRAPGLPATIVQALIDHARAEYPNEACGVIVGDRPAAEGGRALRWAPTRNEAASPYRYRVHPDDLLRLTIETDDADEVFWAIVHSHVRSPARAVAHGPRGRRSTRTRCTSSSRSRRTRRTRDRARRRCAPGGSWTAR